MQKRIEAAGSRRPPLTLALGCALVALAPLAQAKVKPPPLPPGSSMVRVQAGLNDDEVKRQQRAHHHKGHFKKDLTRDDSQPGNDKNDKGSRK